MKAWPTPQSRGDGDDPAPPARTVERHDGGIARCLGPGSKSFPTGSTVYSSPAVGSGVVYIASEAGTMYALDEGTGASLWSLPTGNVIDSSPAVSNGVVYVGSGDDNMYAFGLPN
jgi:outer membrane protein assembly factor BamB